VLVITLAASVASFCVVGVIAAIAAVVVAAFVAAAFVLCAACCFISAGYDIWSKACN